MTDTEFADSTSADFAALHSAWERQEERADRRTALLATLLFNAHRGKQPAAKIEDFMPQKPLTAEQIAAQNQAFAAAFAATARASQEVARG
tara:strand:+ start:2779 stop:3051 length:273 start_codon:yes stop_codon:yes gene_type:complete